MASGALPSAAHRYKKRKDSSAASYKPWRPQGPAARWPWDWWTRCAASRGGRRRQLGLVLVYVLVLLIVVLVVPLPGLSRVRDVVLRSVIPSTGNGWNGGEDVLSYVDPLIGTAGGGHVFAGATVPYGMAKPVADSVNRVENAAGYVHDFSLIHGFSQLHDSGTGGSPSLGNFPLFIHPGCPDDDLTKCTYAATSRAVSRWPYSARARPGYFYLRLKNSVAAEMTATHHASLYRFTFPDASTGAGEENGHDVPVPPASGPLVLVDLQDLDSTRHGGGGLTVDPDTGRITGQGEFRPSFGQGKYGAFFCADFKGATMRRSGTFLGDVPDEERQVLESAADGSWNVPAGAAGGWIQFEAASGGKKQEILARVGVSFKSRERACKHAEREIPKFDFEGTVREAEEAWREKLGALSVDGADVDPALLVTFWSGLYRTMLSPQDYTGENTLWESKQPYYDSFYCIWDSFRAQHPLLSIIDPVVQTDMVRTLIDIYRNLGKLPDCRMSFSKGYSQGGSNADVVIADAYIKGITDGIDWDAAYEAVVSDAEVEPHDWNVEGRGNLESYHSLGYIPVDDHPTTGTSGRNTRSISRTVEYAYEDFTIAQLGRALGKPADDYRRYMQRSTNWRNLWNAAQEDLLVNPTMDPEAPLSEFKGFLQPRLRSGTFEFQSTRTCSPIHDMHKCYLDTRQATYEGSPWLYSFFVPQDMASLITAMGGPKPFVKRLDYFHESGLAYLGNEQCFLPVFQFHYAGRPGRSAHWVHQYIPAQFNTTFAGIPGNDDGAMGAFSGFAMMGFFPVAGQDVYLLTAPFFREVRLRARQRGKWAVIRVANFDPTYEMKYIQSATLNGRPYTRSWITHEFFTKGGVLEFAVGRSESRAWGTAVEDLPPSWGWTPGIE
ncbi:unnamed protein product [Discula destructiva]